MQSGYSASIIKIAAGRRREASGFSPGALTAILYIFILALLYAALFFCLRYVASLYGGFLCSGINPVGRFAPARWRTAAPGKAPDGIQKRWRRLQGGRASNPHPGAGHGGARGQARRGAGRSAQAVRRTRIDTDLTRHEYNVDIATYVSGLDTHCIL